MRTWGASTVIEANVSAAETVEVGHCSYVGGGAPTLLGAEVDIGAFCHIAGGVTLATGVHIDDFCRIGEGAIIGRHSKILYGASVFEHVSIGEECIVGGSVADRTVIENRVTFMGKVAHAYAHPGTLEDWDGVAQPSPVIREGSVVGEDALVIGGISIGPDAYVAAGEIVRCNVPASTMLYKGRLLPMARLKGVIESRR